ncbi:uncharacterized protein FFB20_11528 [Fusarium fujikuroi]|nr:uncharacterized protein FFB20_11528 [Fusarium fujikuroi]
MRCAVLCCAVLCCAVLCCAVLRCPNRALTQGDIKQKGIDRSLLRRGGGVNGTAPSSAYRCSIIIIID